MKTFIIVAMITISSICSFSLRAEMDKRITHQYYEFTDIDKKAMLIPEQHTQTVSSLAKYIKLFTKTDMEFVRALYVWFASPTGMEYDFECAFDKKPRPNQSAAYALKTKQGVCEAYSNIMIAVCRYVNIPAYEVVGQVRYLNKIEIMPQKLHMWVVVKINNTYGLIDPTFGSGVGISSNDTSRMQYVKGVNNAHFFFHPYDDVYLRKANISLLNLRSVKHYDYQRTTFPVKLQDAMKKYPGLRKHIDNAIGRSIIFYNHNKKITEEFKAHETDIDKIVSFIHRNMKGIEDFYYVAQHASIKMCFTGFLLHIHKEQNNHYSKLLTIQLDSIDELAFLNKQLCFFVDSPDLDHALAIK